MEFFIFRRMKQLRCELQNTKKLLDKERQKNEEEAREKQELDIKLWKLEGEIRKYQYRENKIRDVLKYEFWKRISPVYTMKEAELKLIVRLDNLFHDNGSNKWGVVECYCLQCGKALQARYFDTQLEALQYAAVKQAFGISTEFDTCMQCYQESMKECA